MFDGINNFQAFNVGDEVVLHHAEYEGAVGTIKHVTCRLYPRQHYTYDIQLEDGTMLGSMVEHVLELHSTSVEQ